jgi:signal transduction histidine kinase/CheY-like chemotaxis protein
LSSIDPGAFLLRRAFPILVLISLLVGAVRWFAASQGYIDDSTGVALMTAFSIAALLSVCLWSARRLRDLSSGGRRVERDVLYRTVAKNSPSGSVLLFDHDLRYLLVEGDSLRAIDAGPEELEGRTIWEALEPEVAARIEPPYRAALAGQTTAFEMPFRDHFFRVTVAPTFDDEGGITGGLVQTQEITEQKALEEQLRQSQKLEAIGQLAGGVAHDFNNLLTVISGYTNLALPKLAEDHPVRQSLEEIGLAAERAAALTHQLLAFSRKQVLQPRLLDVGEIMSGLLPMLHRLIESHVEVVVRIVPRQLHPVLFDPSQLEQVIVNLVINARDAMPDGGTVTIEVDEIYLDATYTETHAEAQVGRHIVMSVSDTGHGFDEATRSRIFEPFFTTKEVGEGTGLGLSTVHGIVRQSGGNIWVYSEVGRGTSFKIYIPTAPDGVVAEPVSPIPSATVFTGQRTGTVLVVEDNLAVRTLTTVILEAAGYKILPAGSPSDAKALLKQNEVDVVLTDIVMPGGSGKDLADTTDARGAIPAIIYMSGYTAETVSAQDLVAPGSRFLEKPFTPTELLDLMAQTVSHQ